MGEFCLNEGVSWRVVSEMVSEKTSLPKTKVNPTVVSFVRVVHMQRTIDLNRSGSSLIGKKNEEEEKKRRREEE